MYVPNLRHLNAIREVARYGSISAAARHVHLSQPAITQAIAGVEHRLGARLFRRSPSGMAPTRAGLSFAARIERAQAELQAGAAEAAARAAPGHTRGFATFDRLMSAAQLRALIALSRARNFSMAARAVGVSQPSLHRAARDLERLAGLSLFRAEGSHVTLTPAARALARRARLALAEIEQGLSEIEALKGRDVTRIAIGAMPLARASVLPGAMATMLRTHPHVQLRTIEGPYATLLDGLRHGEIDLLLGALRDPAPTDDVRQEVLFQDDLALIVGAGHPLARRAPVTLADTHAYPWVAPPRETPSGSYLSRLLDIPAMAQTPVRVVSSSFGLVRALLTEGDFITIVSRQQAARDLDAGSLVRLPITLAGSDRPIGLTTRAGWRPTATQARFLDILRARCRDQAHYTKTE